MGLHRDKILQDTKIPKTLFYGLDDFNAEKKRIFTNEVSEICLLAILNEDTINIAPFKSEDVNYGEVYVVYVELKKEKNVAKIIEAIQRNILNPVIIVLGMDGKLRFSTATKRLNRAEKGKQVIEDMQSTPWLSQKDASPQEKNYLEGLDIANFTFLNLFAFYQEYSQYVYQSVLLPLMPDFRFLKNVTNADLKPAVDDYLDKKAKMRRMEEEEAKAVIFGDKFALHRKLLDAVREKQEAENTIMEFLGQSQI